MKRLWVAFKHLSHKAKIHSFHVKKYSCLSSVGRRQRDIFELSCFFVVYSKQMFEHLRHFYFWWVIMSVFFASFAFHVRLLPGKSKIFRSHLHWKLLSHGLGGKIELFFFSDRCSFVDDGTWSHKVMFYEALMLFISALLVFKDCKC